MAEYFSRESFFIGMNIVKKVLIVAMGEKKISVTGCGRNRKSIRNENAWKRLFFLYHQVIRDLVIFIIPENNIFT